MLFLPQHRIGSVATSAGVGGGGLTGFHGALVKKSADHTGANYNDANGIALTWDTEVYDTLAFHDPGSDTRLTIPAAANGQWVILTGMIEAKNVTNTTGWKAWFKKGGSTADFDGTATVVRRSDGVNNSATTAWIYLQSHPILVATGDYFELMAYIGDTSMDIEADTSSFSIRLLGTTLKGAVVGKSADSVAVNLSANPTTAWDTEIIDSDGFHDNVTDNTKLIVPSAYNGRHAVVRASTFITAVSVTQNYQSHILYNSAFVALSMGVQGALVTEQGTSTQLYPIQVSTGDFFQATAYSQDTSTNLEKERTFLSIEILPSSFQGVLCTLNADATANYTTPQTITWDGADVYDTDAAHDPSGNPTKIVVPSAWNGKYGIAHVTILGTATLSANVSTSVAILKGGTIAYAGFGGLGGHNGFFTAHYNQCMTQPILLTTGDEFTVQVWNASDTSAALESDKTRFGLYIVG